MKADTSQEDKRGLIVNHDEYSEELKNLLKNLDRLARLFCKEPYTSIISLPTDPSNPTKKRELYLSFPRRKGKYKLQYHLNQLEVEDLYTWWKKEKFENKEKSALDFFKLSCQLYNALAYTYINERMQKLNELVDDSPVSERENIEKQYSRLNKITAKLMQGESILEKKLLPILSPIIKKFLPDDQITLYKEFIDKTETPIVVASSLKKYKGMHVEAKGVYYVKTKVDPEAENFLIGLANYKDSKPGCCCFCTYEFNRLEEGITFEGKPLKLNVYRSADFPNNKPNKGYKLSPYMNGIMPVDKAYKPKAEEIEAANEDYLISKSYSKKTVSNSGKRKLPPSGDKLEVAMNELILYESELGSESLLSALSMMGASDELTS